ncbi:hypothetical protein SEA_STELLA_86 [Streptomyces phage Stella]|nr:hypothetical protein SEA_STELLA_86 [Streptomyces phage Stella]
MARYLTTYSTHDEKSEASAALKRAARSLTVKGKGKTHYAKLEYKRGAYQVNIYER